MPIIVPEDIEAEKTLLATLGAAGILDPGSDNADAHHAVLAMQPEYFSHPVNKAVCNAIKALYADAADINSLSIKATLEAQGTLGRVGGFSGVIEILGGEDVARPMVLVERLANLWRGRELIKLGAEAIRRAQDFADPVGDAISSLATQLSNLSSGASAIKIRRGTVLMDRIVSGEAFRCATAGGKLAHFGVPRMDDAVEAAAGHVITVGARPGVGKSALAVQGVWRTAQMGGHPFLISLEMDEDEIDARMAAWQTLEGYKVFRAGAWKDSSVTSICAQADTLDRITTWCHPSGVSWSMVEAAIRDAVRVHGATSVWIDHVLLIAKPILGKGVNDAACWTHLSRSIKKLAQELRICIIPLIQLNRQGAEGEPKLSDLKESGAWEEDANAVWMLWDKEQAAQEEQAESKVVYVKSAKNRSGPSGWKQELEFRGAFNRLRQIERETESDGQAHSRGSQRGLQL